MLHAIASSRHFRIPNISHIFSPIRVIRLVETNHPQTIDRRKDTGVVRFRSIEDKGTIGSAKRAKAYRHNKE